MTHKLSVTIDGNKIEYEGDAAKVAERFDRLAEAMLRARSNGRQEAADPPPEEEEQRGPDPVESFSRLGDDLTPLSRSDLAPIFKPSIGGQHVLRKADWPEPPGDRLLLAIYGAWALGGERSVTAPALSKAMRASGDENPRADRALAEPEKGGLVETHGKFRSKRYGLTETGVKYCEAMILAKLGPAGVGEEQPESAFAST